MPKIGSKKKKIEDMSVEVKNLRENTEIEGTNQQHIDV